MPRKLPAPPSKAKSSHNANNGKKSRSRGARVVEQRSVHSFVESDSIYDDDIALARIHSSVIQSLGNVSVADVGLANAVQEVQREYGMIGFPSEMQASSLLHDIEAGGGYIGGSDLGFGGQMSLESKSRVSADGGGIPKRQGGSVVENLWNKANE